MIRVYTNNMETVYFTHKVEYESVDVEGMPLIFVKFSPNNGPARGKIQKIMVMQVNSIVDDGDTATEEENKQLVKAIRMRSLREEIESGKLDEYLVALEKSIEYRVSQIRPDEPDPVIGA